MFNEINIDVIIMMYMKVTLLCFTSWGKAAVTSVNETNVYNYYFDLQSHALYAALVATPTLCYKMGGSGLLTFVPSYQIFGI